MIESIINPKRVDERTWKMFFVGLVYASLSIILTHLFFSSNPELSSASGMIVVMFTVMFSLPFMFYLIRKEEKEDEEVEGFFSVWRVHSDAIYALMWLFLGFVVAFAFWHIVLQNSNLLNFQISTYCRINNPGNVAGCVEQYIQGGNPVTGSVTGTDRLLKIVSNNISVMALTLIFSLIFGAGAIFVLAWNASVIAAAIGIFTEYNLSEIPLGVARYMIHGVPEIAAYFVAALAGGIFGAGVLRNGIRNRKSLRVVENTVIMMFIAIILLVLAGVIEVYVTPLLFG